MTEEENKEFEEFLKWKAEKAQQSSIIEKEESPASPVDVEDNETQKGVVSQSDLVLDSDANKESNNTGLYLLAAVMAIVLLFALVIGLSNNKQSHISDVKATEELDATDEVEVDTVAVALPNDEVVSEKNKVTWEYINNSKIKRV